VVGEAVGLGVRDGRGELTLGAGLVGVADAGEVAGAWVAGAVVCAGAVELVASVGGLTQR
jgi:hypothetical protein